MKRYRPLREVLAEVEKLMAERPNMSAPLAVLDQVADLLYRSRNYSWVGISLHAGEQSFRQVFRGAEPNLGHAAGRSNFMVAIRMVGRELGVMELESAREHAFGREERVLLKRVAALLGRYLVTRGKHVLFKLREQARSAADAAPVAVPGPNAALRDPQLAAKKSVKPLKPSPQPSARRSLRPASGVTSY